MTTIQNYKAAVEQFAAVLEEQRLQGHLNFHYNGRALPDLHEDSQNIVKRASKVKVTYGPKWTRVDVGESGVYVVDQDGNIFGIKGYGVPNKRWQFGTLSTIGEWDWSGYRAVRK